MKFLKQAARILAISFVGEVLKAVIPLSIPASVYGLVILLVLLCTGLLRVSQVREAALFLIEIQCRLPHCFSLRLCRLCLFRRQWA